MGIAQERLESSTPQIEEIAIRLHFAWWNTVYNGVSNDRVEAKKNWDNTPEHIKKCYRSQANEVLEIIHDNISVLHDYKWRLNEFYRNKYGGIDITDIMEGEMAAVQGKTIPLDVSLSDKANPK